MTAIMMDIIGMDEWGTALTYVSSAELNEVTCSVSFAVANARQFRAGDLLR